MYRVGHKKLDQFCPKFITRVYDDAEKVLHVSNCSVRVILVS